MKADERRSTQASSYHLCPGNRKRVARKGGRWERGKGEEVWRGSGTSLLSNCCRKALACWAQPWPCAEIPAVYAAQPAPCKSCASSRLGREMGHMAAYAPEARKCKRLAVCLVQEHKSRQNQSHSAPASVYPKGHRPH